MCPFVLTCREPYPARLPIRCLLAWLPCSIDEGLVNPDKPWCGTRNFGMAFYDSQSQVGVAGGG